MKMLSLFLAILLMFAFASENEHTYIGSTPAGGMIKSFLGIPLSDSVDFIRWKCIIRNNRYKLQCNYGIAQPNTNGFVKGGTTIELEGECRKQKNYYKFEQGNKTLKAVELNVDLLHLLDSDSRLLVGNGGWSYTLNSITPLSTDQVTFSATPTVFKDSIVFEGRTPCKVPGVIAPGSLCYKLKWYVVLYANAQSNNSGTFKVLGTPWRKEGGKTGNWKLITGPKGQTIYQLDHENGNGFLYLLKLDENILVFTDDRRKLLVGDEDFSYTLNSRR